MSVSRTLPLACALACALGCAQLVLAQAPSPSYGAAGPGLRYGSSAPVVDRDFFPAGPGGDDYAFRVQLAPQSSYALRLLGGQGYHAWEATTFPAANRLDSTGDAGAMLAYAQAYWTIARYHAALAQARLRHELGFPRLFGRERNIGTYAFRQESIMTEVKALWDAATDDLDRSLATAGEPLLQSQAFDREYRAALDTIRMPELAYGPHGIWVYMGFGAGAPFGKTRPDLRGGIAMDLGLGYRYRAFRVGYRVAVHRFEEVAREGSGASLLIDGRGQWNAVDLLLGYDLALSPRFGLTATATVGGHRISTGVGDDQRDFKGAFSPGAYVDLRVKLGARPRPEAWGGLSPRPPFTFWTRLGGSSERTYRGARLLYGTLVAGLYIDVATLRYRAPEGGR